MKALPRHIREVVAKLERDGFTLQSAKLGGRHWRMLFAEVRSPVFFPCTPSDHRWAMNKITAVRRMRDTQKEGAH
jgi:hypothetical protein